MQKSASLLVTLYSCAATLLAQKPHVVLVSLDGMKPEYVTHAKEHNVHLPVLERFLTNGTYADGVVGVVPTVTYPSHSTMVTGVWPIQHGVYSNLTFDPLEQHPGQWYWSFRYLKTKTLYQAAAEAGFTTAAVSWPVTVGAPIDYLIAEYAQSEKTDVPPGDLVKPVDLEEKLNLTFPPNATEDEKKAAWSIAIIDKYNPNFILIHLAMLDHQQHEYSPFSPQADQAVEKLDAQVGQIIAAELKQDPAAKIVIVSDHGFVRVDHHVALNALLVKAGFITLRSGEVPKGASHIASWQAEAWDSGGTAAIMLHDPSNAVLKANVKKLLETLAADPKYGIDRILDHDEIVRRGGYPDASFLVDFKPGWSASSELRGEAILEAPSTGTHGYLPDHPELRASFMAMGVGIAKGRDLGIIDMRQIAPTLAEMLHVRLPEAKLAPVHYQP